MFIFSCLSHFDKAVWINLRQHHSASWLFSTDQINKLLYWLVHDLQRITHNGFVLLTFHQVPSLGQSYILSVKYLRMNWYNIWYSFSSPSLNAADYCHDNNNYKTEVYICSPANLDSKVQENLGFFISMWSLWLRWNIVKLRQNISGFFTSSPKCCWALEQVFKETWSLVLKSVPRRDVFHLS